MQVAVSAMLIASREQPPRAGNSAHERLVYVCCHTRKGNNVAFEHTVADKEAQQGLFISCCLTDRCALKFGAAHLF